MGEAASQREAGGWASLERALRVQQGLRRQSVQSWNDSTNGLHVHA